MPLMEQGIPTTNRPPSDLLDIGLYTVPEAARLLRAPAHTVRRWVGGYYVYRERHRTFSDAVTPPPLPRVDGRLMLTFVTLMELHLVKLFRDAGVSMAVIRKAAEIAGRLFKSDHPFALKRFDTDGRRIFVTQVVGAHDAIIQDATTTQRLFEHMIRPFFLKVDEEQNEIVRFWPLGKQERVVLDPARAFGEPIDAATGVPVSALLSAYKADGDTVRVATMYRVPTQAVSSALAFEQYLST